ncbi:MAG: hypothetical protein WCF22_08160 [Candidatus Sulfotelmatobacter sp.]
MNNSTFGIAVLPQRGARIRFSILLLALIAFAAIAMNFDQPFVSYAFAGAVGIWSLPAFFAFTGCAQPPRRQGFVLCIFIFPSVLILYSTLSAFTWGCWDEVHC